MKIWFLLLLILFSGCIQNPTAQDRLTCLKLTQDPYTSIPDCMAQEKCFVALDKKFEPGNALGHDIEQELFAAKNSLARSWLFFNLAKKNLAQIHKECESSDYSKMPQLINELNSNLGEVASSIDNFNASALSSMALANFYLKAQGIEHIKNEKLYDDYILLNQNLLDFAQKNTSGNSYASIFLREYAKFSKAAAILGAEKNLGEISAMGLLSKNKPVLREAAKDYDFKFSLLFPVFNSFGTFIEDFLNLTKSVDTLGQLPANELFLNINSIIGSENSAAFEYLSLVFSMSQDAQTISRQNRERLGDAAAGLQSARSEMATLKRDSTITEQIISLGQDNNQTVEIYQSKNPGSGIFFGMEKELESLELEFASISEKISLKSETFGKLSSEILDFRNRSARLSAELSEYKKETSKIGQVCIEKIDSMKKYLAQGNFGTGIALEQKALVESKISAYEGTKDIAQCRDALVSYRGLLEISEKENAGQIMKNQLDLCIAQVRQSVSKNAFSDINLQITSLIAQMPGGQYPLLLSSCKDLEYGLERRISQANSERNEAAVFALASDINSLLQRMPPARIEGIDENNQEQPLAGALEAKKERLLAGIEGLNEDDKKKAQLLSEKISLLIDANKFSQASKDLNELEGTIEKGKTQTQVKMQAQADAKELEENLVNYGQLQEALLSDLDLLEKEFSSVRQDELSGIYHLMPMTLEREKELAKTAKQNLGTLTKIKDYLNSGNYEKALSEGRQANFPEKFGAIQKAQAEASDAVQKLKQNALASYNIAAAKRGASIPNDAADKSIEQAKENIQSKKFVQSILNSQKATGLLELKQNSPDIPLAAYLLGVAVVLIFGYFILIKPKKKDEEELQEQL